MINEPIVTNNAGPILDGSINILHTGFLSGGFQMIVPYIPARVGFAAVRIGKIYGYVLSVQGPS